MNGGPTKFTVYPFRNDSGEVIPPFAAMVAVGTVLVGGVEHLKVEKPSDEFKRGIWFNGPSDVEEDGYAVAYTGYGIRMAVDGTPTPGKTYGPKPDEWVLFEGFPGGTCVDEAESPAGVMIGNWEPITKLLCEATDAIADETDTTDYIILTGEPGSETDGGWTTVPSLRNDTGAPLDDEDRFIALLINGFWYISKGGGKSTQRVLKALLSADLAQTDSTASIDTVSTLAGDEIDDPPDSADNPLAWIGNNNDACLVIEDTSGEEPIYILTAVKWDVVTPVVDVRLDGMTLVQDKENILSKSADNGEIDTTTVMEGTDDCP